MAKGCCGKGTKVNKVVDKRGNPVKKSGLNKYGFLKPNQIAIRDNENKDK